MPDDYYVSQYSGEEIDAAVGRAATGGALDKRIATFVNSNLLDNWYFVNPVDQRGGYVVPPGVDYFALGVPDTAVGQTTAYTTVKRFQDGTPIIVVNSTEYAVVASNAVRGYTGDGYGIDRWKLINDTSTLLITNEGVKLIYNNSSWHLGQFLQGVLRKGITYTYSVLYKASGNNIRLVCSWGDNKFFYNYLSPVTDEWSLATVTGTIQEDAVIDYEQIVIQSLDSGAGTIDIKAAKLELGSQQTLAHQENGVWVLNEIPDYGEQLRRCQRYGFPQHITYAYGYCVNDTFAYVCIPTPASLRKIPVLTVNNPGALNFASQQISPQSLAVARIENNLMFIAVSASGLTPNAVCVLHDADIYISADL